MVLDEVLRAYVERVEDAKAARARVKPMLVLVLTDGRADDPDMVKGASLLSRSLSLSFLVASGAERGDADDGSGTATDEGLSVSSAAADIIVEMAQRLDEERAPCVLLPPLPSSQRAH